MGVVNKGDRREAFFIRWIATCGTRRALVQAGIDTTMQALVVGATLAGSIATAFVLQRALLEAWLRAMQHGAPVPVASPRKR